MRHDRYARREPRAHWLLLSLLLGTLLLALLVQGYVRHDVGRSGTARPARTAGAAGVPSAVRAGGAVLDLAGPSPRTLRMPPRTVALTFDDGPDLRWTPAVLDALRRHGVRATFFLVGSRVLTHPELVRRELLAGHEVVCTPSATPT